MRFHFVVDTVVQRHLKQCSKEITGAVSLSVLTRQLSEICRNFCSARTKAIFKATFMSSAVIEQKREDTLQINCACLLTCCLRLFFGFINQASHLPTNNVYGTLYKMKCKTKIMTRKVYIYYRLLSGRLTFTWSLKIYLPLNID